MTRSQVRTVFVAALVALPLHVAYGKFVDEPYPALILPGFGAAADAASLVITKRMVLTVEFAAKPTRVVDVTDVFPEVPAHRGRQLMRRMAPVEGTARDIPEVRRWIGGNLERRFEARPLALVVDWKETRYRRPLLTPVETRDLSTIRIAFGSQDRIGP
jgi:hypothetical protein